MSISIKSKLTLVVLGLIILTITGLFMGYRAIKNANGYDDKDLDDSKTGIELYVLAPCESCNEEEISW